jgi:hypothetical protein
MAIRGSLVAAVTLAAALTPAFAQASTITLGSPLTGAFSGNSTFLGASVTVVNTALTDPEANVVSPVDGVVVRWRLVPQAAADAYALRVIRPAGGGSYTGAGTSVSAVASTTATQAFPTDLPIRAGDSIGLQSLKSSGSFRVAFLPTAAFNYWVPTLADGATAPPTNSAISGTEFGFNAEVQPAPRLVLVGPSTGPTAGGTSVTIAGSDFSGVSGVKFGPISASYVVNSESQITATAPAAALAGPVDVSVTTIAGTTPAVPGDQFTYTAPVIPDDRFTAHRSCIVPKLTGKKLKTGREALSRANCKLADSSAGDRQRAMTPASAAGAA